MISLAKRRAISALLPVFLCASVYAEDWPTYRHDRMRTAVTSETLTLPLENVWQFRARVSSLARKDLPFRFGWTGIYGACGPLPEQVRCALPMSVAGDSLFLTALDGRTVCLETATGTVRWEFVAGASMNCTPTVFEGKVYVGSDDGTVYCLNADTGDLVWKYKAVSGERWFISFQKMSSILAVRTDVLIDNGIAYFGAGVFPHDGTYVNAIDARTGAPVWRTSCYRYGFAGHLFATKTQLVLPTEFKGFHKYQVRFDRATGSLTDRGDPEVDFYHDLEFMAQGALVNDVRYMSDNGNNLRAWKTEGERERGGRQAIWNVQGSNQIFDAADVVYAGGVLYALGNDQSGQGVTVTARNPENGGELWSARIPEQGHQLVIANGRLFVSTRQGAIYCFAPKGMPTSGVIEEATEREPFTDDETLGACREAARQILAPAVPGEAGYGVEGRGFALVLDCTSGALAYELARQSEFYVCAVFADADKAQKAREAVTRANMHSVRISIHHQEAPRPGSGQARTTLPYPPNFADLIVSEAAVLGGPLPEFTEDLARLQKPIRGIALIGGRHAKKTVTDWVRAQEPRPVRGKKTGWVTLEQDGLTWARYVRPPVENGGGWTHPLGDAGNTMCSHDAALKPPLGVAWNGPPYVFNILALRHKVEPTVVPIVANGVMVAPVADNRIVGYDEYNGRFLWEYESERIGQRFGRFTTLAAGGDSLYIPFSSEPRCLRLDLWTGKPVREYRVPLPDATWGGQAAVSEDGKTIWGTGNGGNDWRCMFALDTETGNALWSLGGPNADNPAQAHRFGSWQAIADGRIYLVGSEPSDEQRSRTRAEMETYLQAHLPEQLDAFRQGRHQVRLLTAVDAMTGKILYERGVDVTDCDQWFSAHAGVFVLAMRGGEKGWNAWPGGAFRKHCLAVHDGASGKLLWKKPSDYRFRPIVTGDTIYSEPWAYDLRTGERRQSVHPITGEKGDWSWVRYDKQCGGSNGSEHFLFGRSKGFGYQDLLRDCGMYIFWHHRQSCSPDTSSGGGMMIKAPLNSGCGCPWSLPYSFAMTRMPEEPAAPFEYFQGGSALPVRHLRVDFGAAGDRRDKQGNLWVHLHPRANPTALQLRFEPVTLFYPGGNGGLWPVFRDGQRVTSNTPVENTDTPHVFDSAALGLKRCVVAVTSPADGRGRFTVRLGFAALPDDKAGQRVFDVRLNGRTVLEDFDIFAAAGGANRAIWKEFEIELDGDLTLDLVARNDNPTSSELPLINGLVVFRGPMLSLGFDAPHNLWLGETKPEEDAAIALSNHLEKDFRGTIAITPPEGIEVSFPEGNAVSLPPGAQREFPIRLKQAGAATVGVHLLTVKVTADRAGAGGIERTIPVEWLGPLERHILYGDDASISDPGWEANWRARVEITPYLPKLPVSKGNATPGDEGMAYAYLMFELPREIGEVRRVRVQLHAAPGLTQVHRVLFKPIDSVKTLPKGYWGAVRRVQGRPDLKKMRYPEWPDMAPESQALAPVAWDPNCVEAPVPAEIARDDEGHNSIYLAIEPTALNGPLYWSRQVRDRGMQMHNAFTLDPDTSPVLLLDCVPKAPDEEAN